MKLTNHHQICQNILKKLQNSHAKIDSLHIEYNNLMHKKHSKSFQNLINPKLPKVCCRARE